MGTWGKTVAALVAVGAVLAGQLVGVASSTAATGSLSSWSPLVPAARSDAPMVYDPAAGQLVLFGGIDTNGISLGDTWTRERYDLDGGRSVLEPERAQRRCGGLRPRNRRRGPLRRARCLEHHLVGHLDLRRDDLDRGHPDPEPTRSGVRIDGLRPRARSTRRAGSLRRAVVDRHRALRHLGLRRDQLDGPQPDAEPAGSLRLGDGVRRGDRRRRPLRRPVGDDRALRHLDLRRDELDAGVAGGLPAGTLGCRDVLRRGDQPAGALQRLLGSGQDALGHLDLQRYDLDPGRHGDVTYPTERRILRLRHVHERARPLRRATT